MKKLLFVFLLFFLIPTIHVSAADTISFSADSIECKANRLIEVSFNAACDRKLSAAAFEFSFDNSVLEFRGVGKPNGTAAEYSEKTGSVKISYLCENGADISISSPKRL